MPEHEDDLRDGAVGDVPAHHVAEFVREDHAQFLAREVLDAPRS